MTVQSLMPTCWLFVGVAVGFTFASVWPNTNKIIGKNERVKQPKHRGETKVVFVIRTELKHTPTHVATMCTHACLEIVKQSIATNYTMFKRWRSNGQPKITLKIDSERDILALKEKALQMGVLALSLKDVTPSRPNAATALLVLGPAPADVIDGISGHLRLY